jgi:hypothetical protein
MTSKTQLKQELEESKKVAENFQTRCRIALKSLEMERKKTGYLEKALADKIELINMLQNKKWYQFRK